MPGPQLSPLNVGAEETAAAINFTKGAVRKTQPESAVAS